MLPHVVVGYGGKAAGNGFQIVGVVSGPDVVSALHSFPPEPVLDSKLLVEFQESEVFREVHPDLSLVLE